MRRGIDPADVALCSAAEPVGEPPWPAATPIVQTSSFAFPDFDALVEGLAAEHEHSVYTRGRNPTVRELEHMLARLERAEACLCFGSGMGAISAVLLGLLEAGDHILFVNQTYGPTLQLAAHLRRFGIAHDCVLDLDTDAIAAAIRPTTRLVWIESPGTMLFRLVDVPAVARLVRGRGILTCMDNSWATPLFQKPIEAGVDIVVHSASKYLGGHGDLMAGAVMSTAKRVQQIFYRAYLLNGALLAPFDAWLLRRGLRTLPLRMRQHEADALRIAEWLQTHPAVDRVFHPALCASDESRPDPHGLAPGRGLDSQLTGTSGLFSFTLRRGDLADVRRVIDGLQRFRIAVSWGGVESLVLSPQRHDAAELAAQRLPPGLIRLSIGLEGADLLIEDLECALAGLV